MVIEHIKTKNAAANINATINATRLFLQKYMKLLSETRLFIQD